MKSVRRERDGPKNLQREEKNHQHRRSGRARSERFCCENVEKAGALVRSHLEVGVP